MTTLNHSQTSPQQHRFPTIAQYAGNGWQSKHATTSLGRVYQSLSIV
jgi:hypothetical protein